MDRTPFAGLTAVEPDESIYVDGGSFLANNPRFTDYLLRLGAKTHRHNGAPPLPNPTLAPAVAVGSGGFLPAATTLFVGYTLLDPDGGETRVSPLTTITTPAAKAPASAAPGVAIASGSGLPIGTYYYAVTLTDGVGGETTLSPVASASLSRASKITLTGLQALRGASSPSVVVYKSTGGAFYRVAETIADTWLDDGTPCADCTLEPPQINTTLSTWSLDIQVPSGAASGATGVRVYASREAGLISPALVVALGSGALTTTMVRTQFAKGSPPPVSLSKGGANRIDPDTELIDWHWKRPVAASGVLPAGEPGDVRIVMAPNPRVYAVGSASASGPAGWQELVMFGPLGPIGPQGPMGSAGPTLNPRGAYSSASTYAAYDNVLLNGVSYYASAAVGANVVPPAAPWVLVAQKGDRGPQGWPGMHWMGNWDQLQTYPLDSLVNYASSLWVAAASGIGPGLPPGSGSVSFRGGYARPFTPSGGVSNEITVADTLPWATQPGHIYYFDVASGGTVSLRATPQPGFPTFDAFGELYLSGNTVPFITDDNGAGQSMPLITATLAPGRYFYVIRGFAPSNVGRYHVDLTGTADVVKDYQGFWDRVFVASGAGGSGGAHQIASGVASGSFVGRGRLVFTGSGVTVTDNQAADATVVDIARTRVASGAGEYPPRKKIAFPGATATDDAANDQVVVQVAAQPEARGAVPIVTVTLASGSSDQGTVALGRSARLLRVAADRACRLRLYGTAAKRTSDASRAIGVDPTGDHGLGLEAVFTASGLSLDLAPQPLLSNMDTPAVLDAMYYDILNMAASGTITVTITRQRLEF